MKRSVYTFNGKDYEESKTVTIPFYVQLNNIQSFIDLLGLKRCFHVIGKELEVVHFLNSDRLCKQIILTTWAERAAEKLSLLGFNDWSEIRFPVCVYRIALEKTRAHYTPEKYMKYKPGEGTQVKQNSPFVIQGTQQVFKGQIWRRIK